MHKKKYSRFDKQRELTEGNWCFLRRWYGQLFLDEIYTKN